MAVKSRSIIFYKNTSANIVFFIFNSLLGLFIVPLFIKNMGADLYGIWILNFSIMNYFIFLNSSISGGIIKNISETLTSNDVSKQIATINVSLVLYLIIGIFIFIFFLFGVDYIASFFKVKDEQYHLLRQMLMISAGFAIVIWPLKVFEAVFLGLLRHATLNIVKGIVSLASSLAIILLLNHNLSPELLLIVFYIISLFTGIILFVVYYSNNRNYKFKFKDLNSKNTKSIIGFSLNLMILEIISMLSFQIDTLVIAYFLPVAYVAIYAVITKLFYLLQGIYGTLLGVVMPMIFDANHVNDQEFILKMVLKGFKYILIFYIPLIIIASILSQPFILLWVGEEFGKHAIWSSIFLLQYLISPAVGVLGTISIGMSKLKYIQLYGAFAAISNFGLSVMFVKIYGFQGVILGTVITTFFGVMIIYPYYCKAINLNWRIPIKENYKEFFSLLMFLLFGFIFISNITIDSWLLLVLLAIFMLIVVYIWMFFVFAYKEDKDKIIQLMNRRKIL